MPRALVTALLAAIVAAGSLALVRSAAAQQGQPLQPAPNQDTEALLRETIQRLVDTLGQALEALPRYAPPEIDKDGNIILRRLNPQAPSPQPPSGWTLDRTSA